MSKIYQIIAFAGLIILFLVYPVKAQQKDFQVWPSLKINAEIYKNFKLHIEEEFRFRENSTLFSRQINDFGASYRFSKYIRAGLFYRLEADWKNADEYAWRNGLYTDIAFRYDVIRFTLGYLLRVQSAKVERNQEESMFNGLRHRHKFSVSYDVKGIPLTPFFEPELFIDSGNRSSLSGLRTWIGADYNIKKSHTLTLKYGFDRELNTRDPLTAWIISLGYSFDFSLISVK
jgi:hypothetical protein